MSRQSLAHEAQQQKQEAAEYLRGLFPIGATVTTMIRHVSRSGMRRAVAVLAVGEDRRIRNVSWAVARVTGYRFDRDRDAVLVNGCGMDAGFEVAYNLARVLYRDGFPCTGADCPSNDHTNERTPNHTPGRQHSDPGYALRHEWA